MPRLLIVLSLLSSYPVLAFARSPGVVDVADFGAKGDGQADDTRAIQQAADAAAARTTSFQPPESFYLGSSPPVYFPTGRYRISGEIKFGAYANVLSDGKAIIEQTGRCRTFVFPDGYTIAIRGISFVGGTSQVHYSNANLDGSTILIEGCEFHRSSDFAIYTAGTTDGHLSANLVVANSRFSYPRQVLRNTCDAATVRDCWVTIGRQNFADDSAAFVNRAGNLMFENMFGVPTFGGPRQDYQRVRWVDNYGDFLARRSRFGGEDAGIPIVYHFGNPDDAYPWMGPTISIENSLLCSGAAANPNASVLTLRGGVPQLIRLVGNKYLIEAPFIRSDGIDLEHYFSGIQNASARFKISIESNMTHPSTVDIPPQLRQFLQ